MAPEMYFIHHTFRRINIFSLLQSLNILIKLMSIISLTMAPTIAGNGDWPPDWWKGLFPIAIMIVGTYLVYRYFWKNAETILPVNETKKDVEAVENRADKHPIM